jgi:CubicO group peptidase (beta-lactamase class C family)
MNKPYGSGWPMMAAAILTIFLLASCGSTSTPPTTYDAAIQEGQTAAQEVINQGGASALTIALVDANRIIWTQTFGLADREAG